MSRLHVCHQDLPTRDASAGTTFFDFLRSPVFNFNCVLVAIEQGANYVPYG